MQKANIHRVTSRIRTENVLKMLVVDVSQRVYVNIFNKRRVNDVQKNVPRKNFVAMEFSFF